MRNLPKLTPLQFLVLCHLREHHDLGGTELRALLAKDGASVQGPAFYQLMARMTRAGLIRSKYHDRQIGNQTVSESRHRITVHGFNELVATREFYQRGNPEQKETK